MKLKPILDAAGIKEIPLHTDLITTIEEGEIEGRNELLEEISEIELGDYLEIDESAIHKVIIDYCKQTGNMKSHFYDRMTIAKDLASADIIKVKGERIMKSFDRWINLLRLKAGEYEHIARLEGKNVTGPSIDAICNEMECFKDALTIIIKGE